MCNFNTEIENTQKEHNRISSQYKRIGDVKIIVCFIGIITFIYNRGNASVLGWLIFAVLCILFILLFVQHENVSRKKDYIEAKLQVLDKYHLRATGDWTTFEDTGEEILSEKSYLEKDLDIIGDKSLFQYLCVANTVEGKKKLAEYLMQQDIDYEQIEERKSAVKELIEKHDFRLEIETFGTLSKRRRKDVNDEWYYGFIECLQDNRKRTRKRFHVTAVIMPVITLLILYSVYAKNLHYGFLVLCLLLQMVVAYYASYQNRDIINKLFRFCLGLDNMIDMVQCIAVESFESSLMKKIQKEINGDNNLLVGIRKLRSINDKLALQKNIYVHVFLQMLFLYDVHCIRELEKWKSVYGNDFRKLYLVIGKVEALLSLGSIALTRDVAFSEISNSRKPIFQAADMYHPLIDTEKVVSNTIDVTKGVNIITGSNMSGKSTFMRTIGINMVLAYAGAPVCAKEMHISIMKLFTCMRITDDVFLGRSSFYAEVLRLKSIVKYSTKNAPMLIIIDEIFKGTNSTDRITGAKEVVRKLCKSHIMLFVSTHDLEICSLIDEKEIQGNNYHFLERYEENEIIFDYKIKDGKCNSKNAKYILRMAGLLD